MNIKINCAICYKEFVPKFFVTTRPSPKYCSKECMIISFTKKEIIKNCGTCKKDFIATYRKSKNPVCSPECIKGHPKSLLEYYKVNPYRSFWEKASKEEKFNRYKEMFEKYVIKKDGCWGWKKSIDGTGSGLLGSREHTMSAYRISWIIHNGEIPDKLWVLHKCDNRICSNPEHLYLGTVKDNVRDRFERNRSTIPYGEKHSLSILNDNKAKEILKLLSEGYSYGKISKMFSISPSTVQNIKERRTWKHVKIGEQ